MRGRRGRRGVQRRAPTMARAVFDMIDKDQSGTPRRKRLWMPSVARPRCLRPPALPVLRNSLVDKTRAPMQEVVTSSTTAATEPPRHASRRARGGAGGAGHGSIGRD